MEEKSNYTKNQESGQGGVNFGGMYDGVNKGLDGFRKIVRENPAIVLGVAFGVGLLVGILTSGKKKDDGSK
ncbi:MAG: DUF883 C-terminal domain-containing protein [Bacteroidetes bacterium]|nr:DUF883 C-terminal domain-containing protein [Bacteroidota bacterium]